MNLEEYFEEFRENTIGYNSYFENYYGSHKILYLDWTASGRLYKSIEYKIINEIGPLVGNTHSESSETGRAMTCAYNIAKDMIREHINAKTNDIIILTGFGTTSAVNKLQRILGLRCNGKNNIPESLKPVVFVTHMEHNSNYISWLETICEVIIVRPGSDGLVSIENLRELLKKYSDRRVKIGAFSACSNVTGIQTQYHELAKVMHEYNGLCFVDFAASAPYINIKMNTEDPKEKLDAIYFSPHKFLGGPGTSGVLVFDSKLYKSKIPDICGGGIVNWTNPWGEKSYYSNIELREDGGTPGFLQAIKIGLSITLKNKMDVNKMLNREHQLIILLLRNFKEINEIHVLADNIEDRLGIISFYIDNIHYNLVVKILSDRFGIQTRGGCACAGIYGHYLLEIERNESKRITDIIDNGDLSLKPGWVRLSVHPIMTDCEAFYIIDSLKLLIKNIDRWEMDYKYNKYTNEFESIYDNIYDKKLLKYFVI